jgi:hypothetical protein
VHTILDGLIDTERVAGFMNGKADDDSRMSTEAIAETYVQLSQQHKSAWTQGVPTVIVEWSCADTG